MDELLKALQDGNRKAVRQQANLLFWTKMGTVNDAQVNEFESYAPCKANIFRLQTTKGWMLAGTIRYSDRVYSLD